MRLVIALPSFGASHAHMWRCSFGIVARTHKSDCIYMFISSFRLKCRKSGTVPRLSESTLDAFKLYPKKWNSILGIWCVAIKMHFDLFSAVIPANSIFGMKKSSVLLHTLDAQFQHSFAFWKLSKLLALTAPNFSEINALYKDLLPCLPCLTKSNSIWSRDKPRLFVIWETQIFWLPDDR